MTEAGSAKTDPLYRKDLPMGVFLLVVLVGVFNWMSGGTWLSFVIDFAVAYLAIKITKSIVAKVITVAVVIVVVQYIAQCWM